MVDPESRPNDQPDTGKHPENSVTSTNESGQESENHSSDKGKKNATGYSNPARTLLSLLSNLKPFEWLSLVLNFLLVLIGISYSY